MSEIIHVIRSAANPTQAPQRAGQHWVNTTTKRAYFSVGTSNVNDWVEDDLAGHLADANPHPQYETSAEAQAKVDAHANLTNNPHSVTKAQVGLSNVDNTSDADKPVSTAQQTALNGKISTTEKGAALGVAPLGADSKIAAAYLPAYVDDVLEYANLASFPVTGESGKIYIALDTGKSYRWTGSIYTEIISSPGTTDAIVEGSINLYFTTARVLATLLSGLSLAAGGAIAATDSILVAFGKLQKQITDNLTTLTNHISNLSNPHAVTKTQVGLGNVQNVDTTTTTNVTEGTNLYFLASRVLSTVLTGLTFPVDTAITAADTVLQALGKLQGQIDVWSELITTADVNNSSSTVGVNVTELNFPVAAGKTYYLELIMRYRSAAANTGIGLTVVTPNTAVGSMAAIVSMATGADATNSGYLGSITALADYVTSPGVPSAAPDWHIAQLKGTFVCTTAGDLAFQFRSEVNTTQVTVGAASVALIREF